MWCALWVILLPGAVGGSVQLLLSLVQEMKEEKKVATFSDIAPLPLFTQALVGCGGALAITLILFVVNQYPTCPCTEWLFLVCLSFVAGFIGHRILPLVASGLEGKIKAATDTARQADQKAQQAVQKALQADQKALQATNRIERDRKVNEAVDAAFEALQQAKAEKVDLRPESVKTHIQHLEALSAQEPTRRRLHIVLGRLFSVQENYEKAVETLSKFVKAKADCKEGSDRHTAAALYNRACYQSLMSEKLQDEAKAREMRGSAIEDLEGAFRLDLALVEKAEQPDPDLASLKRKNEEAYHQAIQEAIEARTTQTADPV